jgi:hypothetical protein
VFLYTFSLQLKRDCFSTIVRIGWMDVPIPSSIGSWLLERLFFNPLNLWCLAMYIYMRIKKFVLKKKYSSVRLWPHLPSRVRLNRVAVANMLQGQIPSCTRIIHCERYIGILHKTDGSDLGVSSLSQNLIRLLCSQPNPPERTGNQLTTRTSADIITILLVRRNYYNTQHAI